MKKKMLDKKRKLVRPALRLKSRRRPKPTMQILANAGTYVTEPHWEL